MLKRNPPTIHPAEAALLVIDMQKAFLDPAGVMYLPQAAEIIPTVARAVELCRAAGMAIVWTRMSHDALPGASYCELFPQHFNENGSPLLTCNTPDYEIPPELGPQSSDIYVDKTAYSAFRGTDLEERLRGLGCDTTVICGIATNVCCESTARDAFALGFRVIVLSDATAAGSRQAHEASLRTLALAFGWVLTTDELLSAMLAEGPGSLLHPSA